MISCGRQPHETSKPGTKRKHAVQHVREELGALDYLIEKCIQAAQKNDVSTFSFGISTVQGGKIANKGLIAQKEAFGARTIVLSTYTLDV
jgi:hypothetical protein